MIFYFERAENLLGSGLEPCLSGASIPRDLDVGVAGMCLLLAC